MRVLGGEARGRRLKTVPGRGTRPPLARVRESLFNILQAVTPGAVWLDLFSGTGSYAIEALSRGAAEAVLVEKNPKAIKIIEENLSSTGLRSRATVIRGDVLKELPALARKGYRFGVVGIAPPYFQGLGPVVLDLVGRAGLVAEGGCVFVQRHRTEELPERKSGLVLARDYAYGETVLSFYVPASGDSGD